MTGPSIPPDVLSRYRKVKAYAERGSGGEKDNARRLMEKLEAKYPGLQQAAASKEAFEKPGTFVVPDGPPPPGFWEAAWDAVGVVTGKADPQSLFFKYMEALENYASVPGGTELVELTDEQAKQLVINAFSPAAGQTPFGGIRLRVDTSGNGGPLIRAYSTSEHNRRMIARHFGAMMMDLMYQILRPSP